MKAMIKSFKFIGASVVFLALAACGKSDNNSNNNVAAVQYAYQSGTCYDVTHNTPAAYNLCTGVGTTGIAGTSPYQYINGQCVAITAPQVPVNPIACQQSLTGYAGQTGYPGQIGYGGSLPYGQGYPGAGGYGGVVGSYGGVSACVGMYYQYNGYTAQLVQCNGYNCTGQFLFDIQTKIRILCQ